MNQPVKSAVGDGRIADLLVPAGHGQLRRENEGTDLIPAFAISQKSRRSGSDSGAMAQSSITSTSIASGTWYNGFGGGCVWRRGWGGPGYATVENIPVGNLMVDVFDSQSKKLIWRGSSSESLSGKPDKNEKKLEKDVAEMFKHFPPPAKG